MLDLRVLVIAEDPLARAGLAALLAAHPGINVVGRAAALDDLLAARQAYRPDVVLWDLGYEPARSLPHMSRLAELDAPVALLLPDAESAAGVWRPGVQAILRRDAPPAQLGAALTALGAGLTVIDPAFRPSLAAPAAATEPPGWSATPESPAEDLTSRELEVLRLMAEGLPNKTIAARLGISEHTVKFHVNAVMGKLAAESRTEAVVRATRLGLILL